ncbi:thiamine pyrophosphate-binding protein [Mycobacterium sp. smrl_JER01]|uniref:thiamine pyrophosphate-binding protein n=1 Tax=Mycobacterium sp. smrl_JER01 TaxID=3402633 RepID=UPI003AC9F661
MADDNATVRGSDLVGRALTDQGVTDLFFMMGIGGPHSPPVRSCIEAGISTYYVRHEEGAAMAAHAYSRLTKRPGVCCTPLGPGTTNALTGLTNALLDAAPVVLIGGGPSRGDWGLEAYQEQDQMSMFRPACKNVHRIELARRIPEVLAIALKEANSGRKGPVYVEIPNDVLFEEVDPALIDWPAPAAPPARAAAPEAELDAAVALIRASERPLLLTGSGIVWADAAAQLAKFVDATGIPLVTTPQTRGIVPEDHPLSLVASRNRAQRDADVVVSVGTRANWLNGHLRPPRFAADTRFVVANIDADEIGRGRVPEVGVVADAGVFLDQLAERLAVAGGISDAARSWADDLVMKDLAKEPDRETLSDAIPIAPLRLCEEVRRCLPRDAVFIVDGHETLEFARRWIPSLSEANYMTSGPNGCMGVGVPFALGAKVARPDRPVFVLMGDGGVGWHGMEYDTLIRHELPMVGVVFNNAGFTARPAAAGTGRELGYQRYDLMVAGFGGHGEFVERPEDIAPALQRAVDSGKPALVNVCVDPDAQAGGGLLTQLGSEKAAR